MRAFVILLLLANIAGWVVLFWTSRNGFEVVQQVEEFHFERAPRELQLLDTSRVSVRETQAATSAAVRVQAIEAVVAVEAPQSSVVSASTVTQIESWCGVSDMLETADQADAWLTAWTGLGGEGQLTTTEEVASSTWWVHLPPFENESDARVVLKELQEKGIDSFYMRTGELVGGISLGVFAIRDSAFLVQADMVKRGYKAEVKEVQRMATRIRVSARLANRAMLEESAVQSLLRDSAAVSLHEIPCG